MPQQLTPDQMTMLGNNFLAIAQAVGDYRHTNVVNGNITQEQNQKLGNLQWTILNYADDFYTQATIVAIENVQQSITAINNITTQIQADYKRLNDVQKVINVAAAVTTLGAAIMSLNAQAIVSGIDGVVNALS